MKRNIPLLILVRLGVGFVYDLVWLDMVALFSYVTFFSLGLGSSAANLNTSITASYHLVTIATIEK